MNCVNKKVPILSIDCFTFLQVIERWEKITDLILKREELLSKLEKFERAASDPNRFFQKGWYTVQPHYNTPHYNADFGITWPYFGSQMVISL